MSRISTVDVISAGLLVIAVFNLPATWLFLAVLLATVVVLNIVVMLDNLECGFGGALDVAMAIGLSLIGALPGTGAVAVRIGLSNWIATNGYVAGMNAVCRVTI